MTKTSKTIVFFGTEDFSLVTLTALVEAGFFVGAVITKPDARRGRSKKDTEPAVKTYARAHDIPVWQPTKLRDITDAITALDSPVGVLVSYGKIVPQSIIDLFEPGIINVHPSLLPRYRGPTPIESAILNGDSETGVSIMQLSAQMDAGPVYSQTHHPLSGTETKPELYKSLGDEGATELIRVLPDIINGTLVPAAQDEANVSYCQLLSKADTFVDTATHTADEVERRIRAHLGFPRTRLVFNDELLIITKAHVAKVPDLHTIVCKDNTLLAVDELLAPSGKTMPTADYLRGTRN